MIFAAEKALKRPGNPSIYATTRISNPLLDPTCEICELFRRSTIESQPDLDSLASDSRLSLGFKLSNLSGDSDTRLICTFLLVGTNREGLPATPAHRASWSTSISITPYAEILKHSRSHLGESTASYETIELSKKWMQLCRTTHPKCKRRHGFLPTRLVDVYTEKSGNSKVRLVRGIELHEDVDYLTLSHCWGKQLPFRLLKRNSKQLYDGFDTRELPKTFQDAILTVKRLCQRYIWIDSLCIVQDDMDDWFAESRQMGKIYQMSLCNIAATV